MKITTFIIMATVASAMLMGLTSCGNNEVIGKEPLFPIGAHASWAEGYTNLNDMVTASQLIIIGSVERINQTVQESEHLYATYFTFQIEKVLKGKENGEIVIYQTGTYDKPWTVIVDNPLFQVGEKYLLFLDNNTPGIYILLGGPVGRYKIINNKVYSMNYVLQNDEYAAPEELNFNGVEVTPLANTITEIMDTVRILSTYSIRLLSGETGRNEIVLATGKLGEGRVSYKVNRVDSKGSRNQIPLPEGMEIIVEPAEFFVSPYGDYYSAIEIRTDEQIITPGEYWISLDYDIGADISGHCLITVYVDTEKISEIQTKPK